MNPKPIFLAALAHFEHLVTLFKWNYLQKKTARGRLSLKRLNFSNVFFRERQRCMLIRFQ